MSTGYIVDEIAVSIWNSPSFSSWQIRSALLNGAACNVLALLKDRSAEDDLRFLSRVAAMRDRMEKEH